MISNICIMMIGLCLVQVPPCLPELREKVSITRVPTTNGMTHTTGTWVSEDGIRTLAVDYKDNRNTFTDQFSAMGMVSLANNGLEPRTMRYRYRGPSSIRLKGKEGLPVIISPMIEDGYILDVCVSEDEGVVMSIVAENIPPETTINIDFDVIVYFANSVDQWDRNEDGIIDESDLAILMSINGIKSDDINMVLSLMEYATPEPPPPPVPTFPREIRITLDALPQETRPGHWTIPLEDISGETISGELYASSDTGGGGTSAAIVAKSYSYASVALSPQNMTMAEWTLEHPNQKWKVDILRNGEVIDTIPKENINNADNTAHYGDALWWSARMQPADYQVGDQWIIYGWDE